MARLPGYDASLARGCRCAMPAEAQLSGRQWTHVSRNADYAMLFACTEHQSHEKNSLEIQMGY